MSSFSLRDPIVAIATAHGFGGVGILRLSFGDGKDDAPEIVKRLTGKDLVPRVATYTPFFSHDGQILDEGIAIYFPSPHSYTGETILELQGHGGPVILQVLLREILKIGAAIRIRHADPGEFTKRAYLNDKLNLAQAEAVADLIEASTEEAAKSAARSLKGGLSDKIEKLQQMLTDVRVLVEACLDFPEEELDDIWTENLFSQLKTIYQTLLNVFANAKTGFLLNRGLKVVLTGEPNVGKSSLLNALAQEDLAIVSDEAGTTRDKIQTTIQIQGVPVSIIDTAGLRDTDNMVERMGVERALNAIKDADCVIHLVDCDEAPERFSSAIALIQSHIGKEVKLIRVRNKIDLHGLQPMHLYSGRVSSPHNLSAEVYLSAKNNIGLDLLKSAILDAVDMSCHKSKKSEDTFSARERHINLLSNAGEHLDKALTFADQMINIDLMAEELRLAQHELGKIVGNLTSDELLGEIFSRFCIGK